MTSPSSTLRLGILGAARIARQFTAAVRSSPRIHVQAVASRDVARAQALATETGIPQVHATYEALLADPAIDAIYNPLPNNLHAEWAIRAAEAGKHVLCEKPLAASASEARAMFAAARRHDVYLVEAYPYRAQPQTLKMRELIGAGAIGRVHVVQAFFGFQLSDPTNIRLNPALAGGALMDAGSYPVSLVRTVMDERPARVHAIARWAESGVDRTVTATIEFASGALAQIGCSFATSRHRGAFIGGELGSIETTYANDTSADQPGQLLLKRQAGKDTVRETIETATAGGFLAEAESFHDLILRGWKGWTGATPEESIDIALTMEAIAASARQGIAVDLAS